MMGRIIVILSLPDRLLHWGKTITGRADGIQRFYRAAD
jgi:hypothetical protein